MPKRSDKLVTLPVSGTALLLIDVINDLAFDGSQGLVAQAEPMAARLAAFKRRTAAAGVPTIYINDNFGQWRSDFRRTVAHCTARSSPGRLVSRRLRPTSRDYFVLKPKHSGFYDSARHLVRCKSHSETHMRHGEVSVSSSRAQGA